MAKTAVTQLIETLRARGFEEVFIESTLIPMLEVEKKDIAEAFDDGYLAGEESDPTPLDGSQYYEAIFTES